LMSILFASLWNGTTSSESTLPPTPHAGRWIT
jgi:hypothetical protein